MAGRDNGAAKHGMLSISIRDKPALYAAYMPYVNHGGLFIPTKKKYRLGDEIFVLLNLMEEPEPIPVVGRVVWITPRGAQGNRPTGIGIQFSGDEGEYARNRIETYLAGSLASEHPTYTM